MAYFLCYIIKPINNVGFKEVLLMKERIAEGLKDAREYSGLKQTEVKAKINLNNKSISNWENGVSFPSIELLIALADLYGVSLDRLVNHIPKANAMHVNMLSPEETKIIDCFRKVNSEGKRYIQRQVSFAMEQEDFVEKRSTSVS